MSTMEQISSRPPSRYALNHLPIDQHRGSNAMWCVIATEAMLFVCMFGAYYYLGTNKDRWGIEEPPSLEYPLILLVILVASSVVLEWGKKQASRRNYSSGRLALWVTVSLGIVFMVLQTFEYISHWKTLAPYSDSYGSIFYAITTLHALHVVAGLLLLGYVGILPQIGDSARTPHRAYETVTLYWHFVDVVWVWIVLLLYVIPHFQGHAYVR